MKETKLSPFAESISSEELAYIAGIVDGEGTITISKQSKHRGAFYPRISVANTSKVLLDWLNERISGAVYVMGRNERWRTAWQLIWDKKKTIPLIEALLPYLVIKKPQAEVVLLLNKFNKEALDKFSIKKFGSYIRPPDDLVKLREECYKDILILNARGRKVS